MLVFTGRSVHIGENVLLFGKNAGNIAACQRVDVLRRLCGGGFVGATQFNVDFQQYMSGALVMSEAKDLYVGILKATVFGFLVGVISVAEGLGTTRGATGVGKSTQRAVIVSFLAILISGYMVTRLFY